MVSCRALHAERPSRTTASTPEAACGRGGRDDEASAARASGSAGHLPRPGRRSAARSFPIAASPRRPGASGRPAGASTSAGRHGRGQSGAAQNGTGGRCRRGCQRVREPLIAHGPRPSKLVQAAVLRSFGSGLPGTSRRISSPGPGLRWRRPSSSPATWSPKCSTSKAPKSRARMRREDPSQEGGRDVEVGLPRATATRPCCHMPALRHRLRPRASTSTGSGAAPDLRRAPSSTVASGGYPPQRQGRPPGSGSAAGHDLVGRREMCLRQGRPDRLIRRCLKPRGGLLAARVSPAGDRAELRGVCPTSGDSVPNFSRPPSALSASARSVAGAPRESWRTSRPCRGPSAQRSAGAGEGNDLRRREATHDAAMAIAGRSPSDVPEG